MAISASLRFEILRRDNHTCTYCGGKAPDVELAVDHVIPSALGGSDDASNLVAACKDCNAGKGSSPPDAEKIAATDARAVAFRAAMIRAAEQVRESRVETDDVARRFGAWWDSWGIGKDEQRKTFWKAPHWRSTVLNYMERGLPEEDLFANVEIAMKGPADFDSKWKYFCGVCRRQLEEMTEIALRIIEEEGDDLDDYAIVPGWTCEICGVAAYGAFIAHNHDFRWHVMCQDCEANSAPDTEWPYWIEIGQLLTQDQVNTWTNHLAEKSWFVFSDWARLVRMYSGGLTAFEPPPITNDPMWSPHGSE